MQFTLALYNTAKSYLLSATGLARKQNPDCPSRGGYDEDRREKSDGWKEECKEISSKAVLRGGGKKYVRLLYRREFIRAPLYSSGGAGAVSVSAGWGNANALVGLRPGEVVLDLGGGAGIDCFLAARAMGFEGKVLCVDTTRGMVDLATKNNLPMRAANVVFLLAEMEALPLRTGSADALISNCAINISLDKEAVFREAFRMLRPGGLLHVCDILLEETLPRRMVEYLSEGVK